jgi:hypothetical protein
MKGKKMSNPFEEAEVWESSLGQYLGEGNYVVKITETDEGTSQNMRPKLILRLEAVEGESQGREHTDYIPYHAGFLDKVVGPFHAADIPLPQEGEFDPADECRLTEGCRKRLVGKIVGVSIRNEPDQNDPNKQWPRVQSYVNANRVRGHRSETGTDSRGLPEVSVGAGGTLADDDVPF